MRIELATVRGLAWAVLLLASIATGCASTSWRDPVGDIAYADAAGNVYRFLSQAHGGILFEYLPVTPERSSTGSYSGGEARRVLLRDDDARVAELRRRVQQLESADTLHAPERTKGTGAFAIGTRSGERHFTIERGPVLVEFDEFVARFR